MQASAASSVWLLLVTYCCYLSPLSLFCCMHATSSSERDRERGVRVQCATLYATPPPAWFAALLPQRCLVNLSDASLLCFPSPATSHVARSYLAQACLSPCIHVCIVVVDRLSLAHLFLVVTSRAASRAFFLHVFSPTSVVKTKTTYSSPRACMW